MSYTQLAVNVGIVLVLLTGAYSVYLLGWILWAIGHRWYRALRPREPLNWNPLSKYPRNKVCFCGSGKKFKQCHINMVRLFVTKEQSEGIKQLMEEHGV